MFHHSKTIRMIFYLFAHILKLNVFSQWTTVNKHTFTIIIGTLLWSILWQFTRTYVGNSIIIRAIYSGFYYLVIADLYTFFMTSQTIYDNNIYNKNFHDINYYNTLEMQPLPKQSSKTEKQNKSIDDIVEPNNELNKDIKEEHISDTTEEYDNDDAVEKTTIKPIQDNDV